ncbi:MAG: hypothetical protein PHH11_09660 [Methylomonas sp.]|nr:hypothetical protein [Methylomonas sp.]
MSGWTASPVISSCQKQGFNRQGEEMKMHAMKSYSMEVYPPAELAQYMQQPSPDVVAHLKRQGVDIRQFNRRRVAFLAKLSLPNEPEDSAAEITLVSEQRQEGGVYKHETLLPRNMLCLRDSPVDTVLASLNHALQRYNWYPPY